MFKFKSKPQISKIQEIENKSESVIFVFKNTLETLIEIEDEVELEIQNKEDQINIIKNNIIILNERQSKNNRFITKLKEFIE